MGDGAPFRMGTQTTISDVAKEAAVSIRTVSRVLNRSPKVNNNTRERVDAAIKKLGFVPSPRARGLATGRSYLVGFIHDDINGLVLDLLQRGIVAEATRRGYEMVVHPTPGGGAESVADVLDFVHRSRVDGLVVMAPVSGAEGLGAALAAEGIPAVAQSSVSIDGFPAVIVTEERAAAANVARYLLGLGHRRIGLVNGPLEILSACERRAGFLSGLQESGVELLNEVEGDYSFRGGIVAAERLLSADPRPSAIFAANDLMAVALLKVAAGRGISVPDELSIVGFDGSLLAQVATPALTTVSRPLGDVAEWATCRLIDLIEGKDRSIPSRATLQLLVGESCGPAPR
ncbi:LacI family DNA-binding transcriptional regulator [Sphingomonas sp. dw_22]|uniref:LacI family DNA-binding transcriptional regulator n=1 Tax=Sphingomonas sp. dw_22 TaxID=2721175 RepID=UPI001BD4DDC4|nr:LacI family DNA-binding transcriptional regulator [Sphingomonas sp. dw_22]